MNRKEMKDALQNEICVVEFVKVNGDSRTMVCTLKESLLPENVSIVVPPKQENEDVIATWDIQAEGWRSFRIDSVKSFRNLQEVV
jgi:hypothetical protein